MRRHHLAALALLAVARAVATGPAAAVAQDPATALDLHLTATVPGEGQGYYLTEIALAVFAPGGGIVVFDRAEPSLLEFDDTGRLVRTIGREGRGPGEFLGVNRVGFLGDTLWVGDYQQGRVSWFVDGALSRVESVGSRGGLASIPATVLKGGLIVDLTLLAGRLRSELRTREGAHVAELADLHTAPLTRRVPLRDRTLNAMDPFADHALSAAAGDGSGVVFVDRRRSENGERSAYTVVRYLDGERVRRVVSYRPRPLTDHERRKLTRYVDAYYQQLGRLAGWPRSEIEKAFVEGFGEPRYALPVHDARMGTGGDVWLRVDVSPEGSRWVKLGEEIQEEETLRLPPGEDLLAVTGDRFLTVREGPLGVPSLHLYEAAPARSP